MSDVRHINICLLQYIIYLSDSLTTAKKIICKECGLEYQLNEIINRCRVCYGSLDIIFDYDEIKKLILRESFLREPVNHWKYWMFYPIQDLAKRITLGEGGTQLLKSEKFGFEDLLLKIETTNPTGSFKDRGSTIEITRAKELNVASICCASTGNMGVSVAAYAAKADISCRIFLPTFVAKEKINLMKIYGADVVRIKGNFTQTLKSCEEFSKKTKTYLVGDYPYRGEGEKSVGFEIADQLNWSVPDYIIVPIGEGTLIYAIWDAFVDMQKVGLIDYLPKMVGVQASGCSPIVNAWKKGLKEVKPLKKSKTLASAINCPSPIDGVKALEAIKKSHGLAETVTDKEMIKIREELARKEGVIAELAGVASLAGALKLKKELEGKIVCIISGSG